MLVMKELGRRGKIPDYIAIQYIVDGIIDYECNKAILYGVTTYPMLKEKLTIYENMKKKIAKNRQDSPQLSSKEKKADCASVRRCFKCGEKDHIASKCKNGVKCYKCNEFGHIATSCVEGRDGEKFNKRHEVGVSEARAARWQPRAMYLKSAANAQATSGGDDVTAGERSDTTDQNGGASDSSERRICQSCQCQQALNVNIQCRNNKSVKLIEIGGLKVECLIDSGSDLNLISQDLFFELSVTSYVKENIEFTGLGATKIYSLGKIECEVDFDGHCFSYIFYVVPKGVMPYNVILGQPFLQNTNLVFNKGVVNVWSQENGGMSHCLFTGVTEEPIVYVPDQKLKTEVEDLVKKYSPVQTKEAPIEMHIVMKDDIPVAQRPRRLAIKEQQLVDNQEPDCGGWSADIH
ncbi:uncharacterized protein LOC123665076 [Melitaea cinxia]|uniref:uncharacterized protein LOC123665076 n=1 Tax=Melitaea cinxia TaxID=113334 RepID=UPI001E271FBF|nr:uncharacterized protein LOC123665076 [Melitaea cinxia]